MSAVHRSSGNVTVLLLRHHGDGPILTVRHQAASWRSTSPLYADVIAPELPDRETG
ncbi:hypothetical protein ABZ891_13240 [Streptomyces sp. NPDC047023]|uniref:hypothetical protein n=1 Tax=Streptomyces sp. NPDC047023 TaxID=3155139 RepID=UPI0033C441A6